MGYDKKVIEAIKNSTGIMATTTSTAVVEALKFTGTKRLSVGAPYSDVIMDKLKDFLEKNGFKICTTNKNTICLRNIYFPN